MCTDAVFINKIPIYYYTWLFLAIIIITFAGRDELV